MKCPKCGAGNPIVRYTKYEAVVYTCRKCGYIWTRRET